MGQQVKNRKAVLHAGMCGIIQKYLISDRNFVIFMYEQKKNLLYDTGHLMYLCLPYHLCQCTIHGLDSDVLHTLQGFTCVIPRHNDISITVYCWLNAASELYQVTMNANPHFSLKLLHIKATFMISWSVMLIICIIIKTVCFLANWKHFTCIHIQKWWRDETQLSQSFWRGLRDAWLHSVRLLSPSALNHHISLLLFS